MNASQLDAAMELLGPLTSAARDALLKRSVEKVFSPGDRLWSAGDLSEGIALVLEGKVRIVRVTGDRQTVIHSGEAGSTLGEVPFFTGEAYPATAIASEPTRCLFFTRAALTEAMALDSRLAFFFLRRLSRRVQTLVDKIDQNTASSVQTRLARFILTRDEKVRNVASTPPRTKGAVAFSLGATQTALAEELGTVREVLVRALRSLREAGAIERAGDGKYRVADVTILRRLAQSASGES
jgi:CRP/FNR family transcriptional regulator, dissimilatory nitrate respiration regulator